MEAHFDGCSQFVACCGFEVFGLALLLSLLPFMRLIKLTKCLFSDVVYEDYDCVLLIPCLLLNLNAAKLLLA